MFVLLRVVTTVGKERIVHTEASLRKLFLKSEPLVEVQPLALHVGGSRVEFAILWPAQRRRETLVCTGAVRAEVLLFIAFIIPLTRVLAIGLIV